MTAVAAKLPRLGFMDRPVGIIFTILAIVVLWGLSAATPVILALVAIAALMFLGLRRPVFAMAALIISQLTVTSYMVSTPFGFPISLHLLLAILIGLIVWRSSRQGQFEMGPKARNLLLPSIIFIVVAIIADYVNSGFDVAYKDFRDLATGIMILAFMPVVIRNIRDLKILTGIALIAVAASATIGILQNYNILGMQSATLIPGLLQPSRDFRVPGIAESALELSYMLSTGLVIMAGVFLSKGLNPRIKWIVPVFIVIAGLALYFTYTRSSLIAVAFGAISIILFLKTRIKSEIVMFALLLVAGFLVFSPISDQYLSGRSENVQQGSTVAREILWQASLNIALDHPILGIGSDKFTSVSTQYQSSVDSSYIAYEKREYWSYRTLGNEPPHNDFLGTWVSYGILALIVFIGLFILIIRIFINSYNISRNNFVKGVSLGFAAAFIAYGINSLYHNMLSTSPLFWILAGFALALSKLAVARTVSVDNRISEGK